MPVSAMPPPLPRPRKRNALLRLYDLPAYRDWAVWLTVVMFVISLAALGTGKKADTGLPRWGDMVFGTATFVLLFGLLPAFLRLVFRRRRWRRLVTGSRSPAPPVGQVGAPVHPGQPPGMEAQQSMSPPVWATREPVAPVSVTVGPIPKISTHPGQLVNSELLDAARHELQYPIARAARAVQLAADRREEYEAVLSAGEALAITLGVSVTAALKSNLPSIAAFSELHAAFLGRGVAQGHWISVLAAVNGVLKDRPEPLPGLAQALRLGPKSSGLIADLRTLVEERNRWAHGAGPHTSFDAAMRISDIAGSLERAIERSMFLAQSPWIVVIASSFRRGRGDFAVMASDAMADHPDFERHDLVSRVPLANDTFYMLIQDGPVDLTPFVVMRDCPVCRQAEVFYADRLDPKEGVVLKSFARGHGTFDHTLTSEVENLFGQNGDLMGSAN